MKRIILSLVTLALILGSLPLAAVRGQDLETGNLIDAEILADEEQATEHDIERLFEVKGEDVEVNANALNYQFRRSWGGEGNVMRTPQDMAIDHEGRLLIADWSLGRVIRVNMNDWSAEVKAWPGDDNMPLECNSIWVDKYGDIYVSVDSRGSYHFFKIDKDWTQILMQSAPGQVSYPFGIAVDSSSRIFVSDTGDNEIKVFNYDGTFLFSFCPEGSEPGQCDGPRDLAFDSQGNLFVVDYRNERLQKFTSDGDFILSIPISHNIQGMTIDQNDKLYLTASNNVLVYETDGTYIREWGGWGDCDYCLKSPLGITVKGATVFVADRVLNTVKAFNSNGHYLTEWSGEVKNSGNFSYARGISIDEYGNIYIADEGNQRIVKTTPDGIKTMEWYANSPFRLEIGPTQELFALDYHSYTMRVYSLTGKFLRQWPIPREDTDYTHEETMAVSKDGGVYVTVANDGKICKLSSTGNLEGILSGGGQFYKPHGVAVDNNGNVFVADMWRPGIKVFSSDGEFINSFGQCINEPDDLCHPHEIKIDKHGNIFVSTGYKPNQIIKVFSPSYQYLGSIGKYGLAAGNFQYIGDIAISKEGHLFVSDMDNSRISQFTLTLPTPDPYSGLVQNGGFEKNPALMEWTTGGDLPVAKTTNRYQGNYGMRLGESVAQSEQGTSEAWAYTNFYVDPNWSRPVLKFKYRMYVNDIIDYSDFFVAVQDGVGLNHLETVLRDGYRPCIPNQAPAPGQNLGWRTASFDLSKYKGQHIRINFSYRNLWADALGIWTDIDDVMVWDEGPLPYVGLYRMELPLIYNRSYDLRGKSIQNEELILRESVPVLN